jgi:hypothetical protein
LVPGGNDWLITVTPRLCVRTCQESKWLGSGRQAATLIHPYQFIEAGRQVALGRVCGRGPSVGPVSMRSQPEHCDSRHKLDRISPVKYTLLGAICRLLRKLPIAQKQAVLLGVLR